MLRSIRARKWIAVVFVALAFIVLAAGAARLTAQQPPAAAPSARLEESLSSIMQQLVVDSVPRQFSDDRQWGKTAKVMNGLKIEHDGESIKIRKHTHEVNDGLWKEYRAELIDPKNGLKIHVQNVHTSGPNQTSLELFLAGRMHGQARLEQWKDGVKLLTITTDADCRIEARLDMDVRLTWKAEAVLGDVTVEPKVTHADLKLVDFQLQKISKLQGWAARELGDGLKPAIAKQLHREEPKLVEKLNAAIAKKQSQLHFSADAAVSTSLSKIESLLDFDSK